MKIFYVTVTDNMNTRNYVRHSMYTPYAPPSPSNCHCDYSLSLKKAQRRFVNMPVKLFI